MSIEKSFESDARVVLSERPGGREEDEKLRREPVHQLVVTLRPRDVLQAPRREHTAGDAFR